MVVAIPNLVRSRGSAPHSAVRNFSAVAAILKIIVSRPPRPPRPSPRPAVLSAATLVSAAPTGNGRSHTKPRQKPRLGTTLGCAKFQRGNSTISSKFLGDNNFHCNCSLTCNAQALDMCAEPTCHRPKARPDPLIMVGSIRNHVGNRAPTP